MPLWLPLLRTEPTKLVLKPPGNRSMRRYLLELELSTTTNWPGFLLLRPATYLRSVPALRPFLPEPTLALARPTWLPRVAGLHLGLVAPTPPLPLAAETPVVPVLAAPVAMSLQPAHPDLEKETTGKVSTEPVPRNPATFRHPSADSAANWEQESMRIYPTKPSSLSLVELLIGSVSPALNLTMMVNLPPSAKQTPLGLLGEWVFSMACPSSMAVSNLRN